MKNIDVVNKIIADKYTQDERSVKLINSFYWKKLRSKLVGAEVQAVSVKGLGTFTVSYYNLYENISETIKKIRSLRKSENLPEKSKTIRLEININRLRALLKRRDEVSKQYYDKRISKLDTGSSEECR
jgi:hypothetical protein